MKYIKTFEYYLGPNPIEPSIETKELIENFRKFLIEIHPDNKNLTDGEVLKYYRKHFDKKIKDPLNPHYSDNNELKKKIKQFVIMDYITRNGDHYTQLYNILKYDTIVSLVKVLYYHKNGERIFKYKKFWIKNTQLLKRNVYSSNNFLNAVYKYKKDYNVDTWINKHEDDEHENSDIKGIKNIRHPDANYYRRYMRNKYIKKYQDYDNKQNDDEQNNKIKNNNTQNDTIIKNNIKYKKRKKI